MAWNFKVPVHLVYLVLKEIDSGSISILGTVLISWGCHTKYQKLDGLKQQKSVISVPEIRSLKSRCKQAGPCSLMALGETLSSSFSSFWWSASNIWCSLVYRCITPVLSSQRLHIVVPVCVCVSFTRSKFLLFIRTNILLD